MKKPGPLLLCILSLLLLAGKARLHAQKENNIWTGGINVQINFNNGYAEQTVVPVPITSNQIWQANATVSGSGGQLLFYTNGREIRDANYAAMPNGYLSPFLVPGPGNYSVTIVPFPQDTNRFYVFYIDGSPTFKLNYSVVDMTLNGGLGDVVSGQKDIVLDNNLTGHLGVVAGNNCNFWVMVHDQFSNAFKAYDISATGINTTPVLTHTGATPGTYIRGGLEFSPNRQLMVMGIESGAGATLFRFDATTGTLNTPIALGNTAFTTSLCFSPDNSRLYLIGGTPPNPAAWWPPLWQFTLSDLNPAAINASQTFISDSISNTYGNYELELGPDGKIYSMWNGLFFDNMATLARIEFPNNPGTSCNLVTQYLPIYNNLTPPTSYNAFLGCRRLHTSVPRIFRDTLYSYADTFLCSGSAWHIAVTGDSVSWNDGSHAATRDLTAEGVYTVTYKPSCHWQTDTLVLKLNKVLDAFTLGPDTLLCAPAPVTLEPDFPDSSSHTWSDGSQGPAFTLHDEGSTFVQVYLQGCTITDSFTISIPRLRFDLGSQPVLCRGTKVTLDPKLKAAEIQYTWQDGSHNSSYTVSEAGTYWLTASVDPCSFSDTIAIAFENCDCPVQIPTAFSPNHDGLNDIFLPVFSCSGISGYVLDVFNRWGERVFQSQQQSKGWDGTHRSKTMEVGTYFFQLSYTNKNGRQEYRKGSCTLIR